MAKLHEELPQPTIKTYLDLINDCDSFPYYQRTPDLYTRHLSIYYFLYVEKNPALLGFVLPSVAEVLDNLPAWEVDREARTLTLTAGDDEPTRTAVLASTTSAMRKTNHFAVLDGWRNELYPVYGPGGELLFSIERSASALFGVVTYGSHMTAYVKGPTHSPATPDLRFWVARRSRNKQTYPSMLDNTAAGGIATGETPMETMVREAAEEAGLDTALVRKGIRAAGTVSYFHIRDERAGGESNLLQPECQYVYDLELDEDTVPKPADDEVEGFELMTIEEVKRAMATAEFKPNCAVVMLDFFVRHGIITAENEKSYVELIARMHRIFEFPTI